MQILKIIALLIEYPDETLWENRDEALSLIAQDALSCCRLPAST